MIIPGILEPNKPIALKSYLPDIKKNPAYQSGSLSFICCNIACTLVKQATDLSKTTFELAGRIECPGSSRDTTTVDITFIAWLIIVTYNDKYNST